jgi:uncharacterized membrane protein YfcA
MPDGLGLAVLLFLAAVLYTSVGHAGASGYLAVFAFYDLPAEVIRPAALVLNIVAATPATLRFRSAGHFDRRVFLTLAVGSVPMAFLGGQFTLSDAVFRGLLASALTVAGVRLVFTPAAAVTVRRMPVWAGVALGLGIGSVAGLTGIGGGVYLTPVLLLARWADTKTAAGVSAAFILVNSLAGLAGQLATRPGNFRGLPDGLPVWVGVVVAGGLLGSTLGSRVFGAVTVRRVLAVVLFTAAGMLLLAEKKAEPQPAHQPATGANG